MFCFIFNIPNFNNLENLISNCPPSHFQCGNKQCIRSNMMCNGEDDCGDNTDETTGCNGRYSFYTSGPQKCCRFWNICILNSVSCYFYLGTCPDTAFRCHNKRCVQYSRLCDGINDCLDNSDEEEGCSGNKTIKQTWESTISRAQLFCFR